MDRFGPAHADHRTGPHPREGATEGPAAPELDRLRRENVELRHLLGGLGCQLTAAAEALARANTAIRAGAKQVEDLHRELAERDERLRRKDLFDREVDHRVKTSLQRIISLMRIQADREKEAPVQAFARNACARLETLATAHEIRQVAGSPDSLDFSDYLDRLCACLRRTMAADGEHRALILEADPVILRNAEAQPLALVVNELVTNAFRHAFRPGKPGTVWVQLSRRDGALRLTVADDGCGLPPRGLAPDGLPPGGLAVSGSRGFGLRLVRLMAGQVGARMDVGNKGGAHITLALPVAHAMAGAGRPEWGIHCKEPDSLSEQKPR